jgi:hypothetical protein
MGQPSQPASNGIIYTTYAVFLCANHDLLSERGLVKLTVKLSRRLAGLLIAWRLRHQSKGEYLATLRTQKGQHLIWRWVSDITAPIGAFDASFLEIAKHKTESSC